MNAYDTPSSTQFVDENGDIVPAWLQWAQRTHVAALSVQSSGATADRPTAKLWNGRFYFDTTLNKPIWIKAVKPAVVWVDATGSTV